MAISPILPLVIGTLELMPVSKVLKMILPPVLVRAISPVWLSVPPVPKAPLVSMLATWIFPPAVRVTSPLGPAWPPALGALALVTMLLFT